MLETGPGHAIRCIATPYAEAFEQEKRKLQSEGASPTRSRAALEALNVGRLRVASKGIDRAPANAQRSAALAEVADDGRSSAAACT